MAKTTSYDTFKNPIIIIMPNQQVDVNGITKYQTVVEVRLEAVTTEGAIRKVSNKIYVGNPSDTPLTDKQFYNQINNNQTGGILAAAAKTAYLDAINENISA